MHPRLHALLASYEPLLAGRSGLDCQRHPAGSPDFWSAQEIVGHLVLTYRSTTQAMQTRLERGAPTSVPLTWKDRIRQGVVLGIGHMPRGRRAPELSRPQQLGWAPRSGSELAEAMHASLDEMDAAIAACAVKFGTVRFTPHFALGPLTAEQWYRFHQVHGRHHLRQLQNVLVSVTEKSASTSAEPLRHGK
jgi:DinB superfamily